MLELAGLSVRSGKSYELFSSYTLPATQIPQLLFPALFGVSAPSAAGVLEETSVGVSYFGAFNFHELTGYVGLLTCMLATLGFVQSRREKIVIFWAGVALFACVAALGDSTPLFRLLYQLPGFNRFRAHGRLFMLVAFACAVMAGYAIRAMEFERVSLRLRRRIVLGWSLLIATVLIYVLSSYPQMAEMADVQGVELAPFFMNGALGFPLAIFVVSAVLLYFWSFNGPGAYLALFALLLFDLGSFAFISGSAQKTFDGSLLTAPEHAVKYEATKRRKNSVRPFTLDDARHHSHRKRLDVDTVGNILVRHDRRRIGVDENDLDTLLTQRLTGLRTGVIKLSSLADNNRTRPNNQNLLRSRVAQAIAFFVCPNRADNPLSR